MKTMGIKTGRVLAFLLVGLLASAGAMAEKPDGAGGGKHGKFKQSKQDKQDQKAEKHNRKSDPIRVGGYFREEQRTVVYNYYGEQYRTGRCPPGLARKNNGCMAPGQARKWVVGRALPPEVVYYEVPPSVVVQLGAPLPGHRYVRVASDILLIAIGTGMVIDGLQDLGRR